MTTTYFFMLVFVFWFWYNLARKFYKLDKEKHVRDSDILADLIACSILRLVFAGFGTWFFYQVW